MAGVYTKNVIETEVIYQVRNGEVIPKSQKTVEQLGRGLTKTTTELTKYDKTGKASTITTERMNRGMQKFQMEQLGVMFAGMALNRSMANLNSTSREWLGIGDLMSTMMGVTMLESNLLLLENGVLPLFDALTNLPEPAQKAIGLTSFALEGLGATMMVGGQLALGLSSTLTVLEKMGGAGGAAAGAATALKKLAGISIVGVGVSLGIASIMADDGTSILYALGSGLAIGLGVTLLGASAATGITLGALTVSGLIVWNMTSELGNQKELYDELGKDVNDMQDFMSGKAQERGAFLKGTRITEGGPPVPREILSQAAGFQSDLLGTGNQGGQSVVLNANYNVQIADKREFEEMLKRSSNELVAQVRRGTKV